jgi:hypothetical protein
VEALRFLGSDEVFFVPSWFLFWRESGWPGFDLARVTAAAEEDLILRVG